MLPIGDVSVRRRVPLVTICLIAINALVFLYQLLLPAGALDAFILQAGLVPAATANQPTLTTVGDVLTSMFMHGGWSHILGNMLYLWIFGDNIEDALGRMGYLLFYLLAGSAAALLQVLSQPGSTVPMIGASGAIAGVLGAYMVFYPRTRVRTLLTLGFWIRFVQLPALVVLGYWFLLQLFNGVTAIGSVGGGVAWWAHIGGFLFGLAVGWMFRGRVRKADGRQEPSVTHDGGIRWR